MKWQTKIRFTRARLGDLHRVERERLQQAFTEWKMTLIDAVYPVVRTMNVGMRWVK